MANHSWGRSNGSLFKSYNTKVYERVLLFSLDCSIYLQSVSYNTEEGSIKYHFFWVFGMNQPGMEPQSPRLLVNTNRYANGLIKKILQYKLLNECVYECIYPIHPPWRKRDTRSILDQSKCGLNSILHLIDGLSYLG